MVLDFLDQLTTSIQNGNSTASTVDRYLPTSVTDKFTTDSNFFLRIRWSNVNNTAWDLKGEGLPADKQVTFLEPAGPTAVNYTQWARQVLVDRGDNEGVVVVKDNFGLGFMIERKDGKPPIIDTDPNNGTLPQGGKLPWGATVVNVPQPPAPPSDGNNSVQQYNTENFFMLQQIGKLPKGTPALLWDMFSYLGIASFTLSS